MKPPSLWRAEIGTSKTGRKTVFLYRPDGTILARLPYARRAEAAYVAAALTVAYRRSIDRYGRADYGWIVGQIK